MKAQGLEAPTARADRSAASATLAVTQNPVLVAVDLSEESKAALIWGCDYAARIGAPLEILHVIHDPADAPGRYRADNGDPLEPMTEVAERKLAVLLDRVDSGHPDQPSLGAARTYCMSGLPAATILQVAEANGACHLVLGGRRRNGLARLLHGSTAGQVTGQARVPVTVVRADD